MINAVGFINGLGIGPAEMGVVLFVFLLLFGAKKLPEIARTMGRFMEEMRRASNEFKHQLNEAGKPLEEVRREINQDIGSLRLEGDSHATPVSSAPSAPAALPDGSAMDYDGLVESPAPAAPPAVASAEAPPVSGAAPAAESAASPSPVEPGKA